MTPTAAWYEADADDSDRSITEDVTANAHETARAATEAGETGVRVRGDADLLRKRTAALDRVAAENERLRGEVAEGKAAAAGVLDAWRRMRNAALAAEAKLRDVEALPRHMVAAWLVGPREGEDRLKSVYAVRADDVDAVLARSQAPRAPADQEGE